MSNVVPPSGGTRGQHPSWTCPSCGQSVQGSVKRHFPIRSGDMQMRYKCSLCGHRHFRAATQQEWNDLSEETNSVVADSSTSVLNSSAARASLSPNNEAWFPRTYKRLTQSSRKRSEKRSLEKLHARVERATPESVSASAHQLLIQSVIDKSLGRLDSRARMVPAELVADLLIDLHQLVAGSPAQVPLESLLGKANASFGLHMPTTELQRSLAQIKRASIR